MNGNKITGSEGVDLTETINNFGDAIKYLASNCKRVRIHEERNDKIKVEKIAVGGEDCGCSFKNKNWRGLP